MPKDPFSALLLPALIADAHDRITAINAAAEDYLNASSKTLIGRSIWDVLQLESDITPAWERARADVVALTVQEATARPTGRAKRLSLYCAPFAGGMVVAITPVQTEGIAGGAGQRAARTAIGMSEMLAHEIKNPLAGITGAAQLLSMTVEPEEQELTDLIVQECRRITALLGQVEAFGNLQPPVRSAVNLHDVLDRAQRSAELGFANHMRFKQIYDPSLPEAYVNQDQILQVIMNLVKNAAEASPEGATIQLRSFYDASLRARSSDGAALKLPLHIEICDDGPGLPPDIRDQAFEPFVSGRENGTGLGLALVSKLMRDNGGVVSADSAPGRTVFRLSLPRVPKEA